VKQYEPYLRQNFVPELYVKPTELFICTQCSEYFSVVDFIILIMDGSFRETRHLKDLILVNLDLIQQQQELLAEKDKRIHHLRHENETVRLVCLLCSVTT